MKYDVAQDMDKLAGCCEHGSEPLCLIKRRKSLGCLGKY